MQGTYSAANSYLEGLAKYRRLKGLPGRCIQWGPVADVGVVGRNAALTVMSSTETAGVQLTTPEQVCWVFWCNSIKPEVLPIIKQIMKQFDPGFTQESNLILACGIASCLCVRSCMTS